MDKSEFNAYKLLLQWNPRTLKVLRFEKNRLGVNKTYELENSLTSRVIRKSDEILESHIEFLQRGRFVDMGVGKKKKLYHTRERNKMMLTENTRKPKKWYSRAFWGRLNDLQGAIGFELMESTISAVKAMEERPKDFK